VLRVVVLVPRRSDGGWRDSVWRWLQALWSERFPEWQVVEGHDSGVGFFSRCDALNEAARDAGDWDVAVIADADSITSPWQSAAAVGWAASTGRLTYASDEFLYLSRERTEAILSGYGGEWETGVEWTLRDTQSSQLAVPRALWDEVRGFDGGFTGWGFEDVAFAAACETMAGAAHRVPGPVWHLWHPPSTDPQDVRLANRDRLDLYLAAQGDRTAMRALLDEVNR
jgi:hypothetical protein